MQCKTMLGTTLDRLCRHTVRAAIGGLLAGLPLLASAWWNADWASRMRIDLSGVETPSLAGPIQQVPVPIRLHAGNFDFAAAQEGGSDLRFVAGDDKTPLNFHL